MRHNRTSPLNLFRTVNRSIRTIGGVALIAAGCSANHSASQVKHDYNQPVRDGDTWNWRAATDDDYATLMAPLIGIDASSILPTDSVETKQAQRWLNRIDAYVRGAHPTELANVPKPQAKVLRQAVPNAFVAPIPSCYNVAVQFPGSTGASNNVDSVFVDVKTGTVESWPAQLQCKDGTATQSAADTINQFVAHFNANSPACQFSVGTDGTLIVGDACKMDPALAGVSGARNLVLLQTANFVTVHSGIMPIMTEAQFVSVLAHELGHYYRSHLTAPAALYDYFYTLQPTEQSHKPTPEPDKAQLGQAAVVSSAILDADDNFVAVPGQKLSSQLYFAVGGLITQIGDQSTTECSQASALLNSSSFSTAIGRFPFARSLTAQQQRAYNSYESAALACLQTQSVGTDLTWDNVKTLAATPTWPTWIGSLPPSSQALLAKMTAQIAARLGTAASDPNLATALVTATSSFATQDQQAIQVLDQIHAQHIGQYTIEQEADDESGEWIADMGFDPETEVQTMRALGKGMPASLHGETLGQDDCDALWNKHWVDAQGNYIFVPIGDFTDPHHSICYRMFNIERDVAAHNEKAANVAVPAHDGSSWANVQADATQLTPATHLNLTTDGGDATQSALVKVNPLVQRTGAMSCTYSYSYR